MSLFYNIVKYTILKDLTFMDQAVKKPKDYGFKQKLGLDDLLEVVDDWIWIMDIDGVHVYSNQAVERLLGYKKEEVIGEVAWEFWPAEDKEKIKKSEFQNDLKKEKGWNKFPGKFKHKDGTTKFLESSAVPIYDDEKFIGYLGIDRDVTKRRKIKEREKFLYSLLRHDLNNKIQITRGYLKLIKNDDLSESSTIFLQKAINSLKAQNALISKICKLRKIDEQDTIETVSIKRYLAIAVQQVSTKNNTSDVDIQYFEDDFKVLAGNLLDEVFYNLIENSLKHSRCEFIRLNAYSEEKDVVIVFEDDGEGINNEKKDKIFDKGFKGPGSSGSGLGMFLVKRIIEDYGGDITLKDSEMGGVKFKIRLKKAV